MLSRSPLGLATVLIMLFGTSTANPSWGGSRSLHNSHAHAVELARRALPSGWPSTTRCITDNTKARVLSNLVNTSTTQTSDKCVALCNTAKYRYAGVEFGKECWCGNALPSNLKTSTGCNMACGGNKNQNCGGGNALRLFTKAVASTSSRKTTTTSSRRTTTTTSLRSSTTSSKKTTSSSSVKLTSTSSSSVNVSTSVRVSTSTSTAPPTSAESSSSVSSDSLATSQSASATDPVSSSATSSSAAPGPTYDPNAEYLFPKPITDGWSVANLGAQTVSNLRSVPFNNSTLIIKSEAYMSSRPVVEAHGRMAMKAHIPKGAMTPGAAPYGGFSFLTPGPGNNGVPLVDLRNGKELIFSYSIYFQSGFDFNLGGKLPGLYGGVTESIAATCSGGRHDPGCWSARLMFRPEGQGELYLYIPQKTNNNDSTCGPNGTSVCLDTGYGNSVGRGNWYWKPGQWQTVSQRILLNTPGVADGEVDIIVDGINVLHVNKITWRTDAASVTRGAEFQIFFGGHTDPWRSPKTQDVYFADMSAGIVQNR